jgi:hypothetical protein
MSEVVGARGYRRRSKANAKQLFYSKRSQFVYGRETEVANVSVGRAVSCLVWSTTGAGTPD